MGKDFRLLFLLFFTLSFAWAEEPYRTFKTPQGKSFEGKVVGYEGQTFILSNKAGALFKVPFNALSNEDKSYLIEAVQQNRIPKGTHPLPVQRHRLLHQAREAPSKALTRQYQRIMKKQAPKEMGSYTKLHPRKKSSSEKVLFSLTYPYLLASAQKRLWPSCKVRNPSQVNRLTSTVTSYPSSTTDAIVVTTPPLTEAVDSSIRRLLFGSIHTNK